MRIFLAATEAVPFAKTGGLADVASALPKALVRLGHDARIVMPRYASINAGNRIIDDLSVPINHTTTRCSVFADFGGPAPIYFIDSPEYFHRQSWGKDILYGEWDDAERFAFFSRAVLELCKRLGDHPDIVHCNDWMTGFIPAFLKTAYAGDPFFNGTRSVFTIHNIAYQGLFDPASLSALGFDPALYRTDYGFELYGQASALKIGLVMADVITTVSPKYASEIQTPEYGGNLDGLLRWRKGDLIGILNGVDYEEWNPATDHFIAAHYSPADLSGKQACKADMLRSFWLPDDVNRPTFGLISRLTAQKGIDLVMQIAYRIVETGSFIVILGSGDNEYERQVQQLHDAYQQQVGIYLGFNNTLAHKIEAGADFFLMPSAFEPCGLNQIYSLKYGTIPIVRATGGLDDTVQSFDRTTKKGNGFKFYGYSPDKFLEAMYESLITYQDKDLWRTLMLNGMNADFSWERSARQYIYVYEAVMRHG
ncbi:MAG TPA: glycogen synthase GlgA [Blastocatellia bacterium]|nr:glycogen synthase GlgA [Blastocatellia bacterium]